MYGIHYAIPYASQPHLEEQLRGLNSGGEDEHPNSTTKDESKGDTGQNDRINKEGSTADTRKITGITVKGKSLMDILRERQKNAEKSVPAKKKSTKRSKTESSSQKERLCNT